MKVYIAVLPTGVTVIGRAEDIGVHTFRFTKPYMLNFVEHPQQPGRVMPQAMPYSIIPGITDPRETLVLAPGQYVDIEEADGRLEAIYSKVAFNLDVPARQTIEIAKR